MQQKEWRALKQDGSIIFAVCLFVALIVWWAVLFPLQETEQILSVKMIWGASYQLLALWGGIWGIAIALAWGGIRSVMGRAILSFAVGLLLQNFGQSVFSYYNLFAQVEMPYPSLADVGYFGSIPFYIYGILLLGRASGITISLKSFSNQIQAVIIPVGMLLISYCLFLSDYQLDWSSPIRVILDFGYPLGQAVYVSIAILIYLLSKKTLGGVMKDKVLFILIALIVQYLADYNFLYQAGNGSWTVSGYGDVIYLLAYFLMAIGLIQLKPVFIRTQNKNGS